jgi:hypothetical protein
MAYQTKTGVPSTVELLQSEYGEEFLIPLAAIAEKLLGINENTAKRKAGNHSLPFPALKLLESQKSVYVVEVRRLAEYLDKKFKSVNDEWLKAQAA